MIFYKISKLKYFNINFLENKNTFNCKKCENLSSLQKKYM